ILVPGVRSLYNTFKNIMGLDKLQSLAPFPIYKQGPHGSDFNFKSNQFGYYNPEFVRWAADNLIPAAKDPLLRRLTQPVYDTYLQDMARGYHLAYTNLRNNPKLLKDVIHNYQKVIEEYRGQKYDVNSAPGGEVQMPFFEYSRTIDARGYKWDKRKLAGFYA